MADNKENKSSLPAWSMPVKDGKYLTGLKINNSMTGNKVEFVPINGKTVTWYGCGPTVYDAAHMGHARTYVTFDSIRRVMSDYFGYDVRMVMNITDLDDKIIKRANEQNTDCTKFARFWEKDFLNDMKALNVQLPDVMPRVTEYVPDIIEYIQRIVTNGFAYESDGSVYFDTEAFKKADKHVYGRMEPWSVCDQARVLEGEGELGVVTKKRNPTDFVLWKKAKPGEPEWKSPWGMGRPGWHIECSAMACNLIGFPIDIHSGGIDLRFPHHDNELAQSEACYNKPQWVNYFMHTGHLNINNLKMSKSLKNFITIKDILAGFSPRHVRILCLLHRWDAPMNYDPNGDSMEHAGSVDKGFADFFGLVRNLKKRNHISDVDQKWRDSEFKLANALTTAQSEVHGCLCDNFDLPAAIKVLQRLVSDTHVYINGAAKEGGLRMPIVLKSAEYIFNMLKIVGITTGEPSELNYDAAAEGGVSTANVAPVVDLLSEFRSEVRALATKCMKADPVEAKELLKEMLKACDRLRDEGLPEVGVKMEDRPDGTIWRQVNKDELLREKQKKAEDEEKKKAAKEAELKKLAEAKARKELEASTPPEKFYILLKADEYKEFDASGIPTVDKEGKPVSKSATDKIKKFLVKHKEVHEKWLAQNGGSPVPNGN